MDCHTSRPADENRRQKATLILEDGETLVGSIQTQDDEAIGFINEKGMYRRIPVKDVLFVTLADKEGKPAAAPPAPTAAPEPPTPAAGVPEKFQPPATGILTIPAGAAVSIAPTQTVDSEVMFVHQVFTGEITADVRARPIAIPRGSIANLEVLEIPPGDGARIVFGLAGVNINGHLFKVNGGGSARLGTVASSGGGRLRVSNGTVLLWQLPQPVVLKEVK